MNDDRPQKVTVDEDIMDDECIDYLVVVPIDSVWFNKIKESELSDLPIENQIEIIKELGEITFRSILGLNETSYDDIDIAKAYHLLMEEGYTITTDTIIEKNTGDNDVR